MRTNTTFKKSLWLIPVISLACVACAYGFMSTANADINSGIVDDGVVEIRADELGIDIIPAPEFPVNEDGVTYGTVFDIDTGQLYSEEPELQLTEATNGQVGYVYKSDLDELCDYMSENPELLIGERVEAIQKTANEIFGIDVVDYDAAYSYASTCNMIKDQNTADEGLVAQIEANVYAAYSSGEVSQTFNDVLRTNSAVTAAISPQQTARGAVDYDKALINVFDQAMSEASVRYVPVYLQDGKTVIGEYKVTF